MAGSTTALVRRLDPLFASAVVLVGSAALVAFAPWRPPGFVSDSWYLLARYGALGPADVLARFLPHAAEWYRPITETGFWLTWQMFGLDPMGHFAVHVAAHALAAVLLGAVALELTRNRYAALAAGAAFLLAPQAHEVVWDMSSLHRVLSAAAVAGAVLWYLRGRRATALACAVAALLIDEVGVIVVPLLAGYELLYGVVGRPDGRLALLAAARRLVPIFVVTLAYAVIRLAAGGVYNEVAQPCRSAPCLAVGAAEYLNRLAVRGDDLMALLSTERPLIAVGVAVVLVIVFAVAAPWRWPGWRVAAFAALWVALGVAFFMLTLWPYVADRFVYVPAMGGALLVGALVDGVQRSWSGSNAGRRVGLAVVISGLAVWLAVGSVTLADRGRRWVDAGAIARTLAADLHALLPAPPSGSVVLVHGQPHSARPTFPPGNTGPYVYLNGMEWAMRLTYGWPANVALPSNPDDYQVPPGRLVLEFEVVDGHVVPVAN